MKGAIYSRFGTDRQNESSICRSGACVQRIPGGGSWPTGTTTRLRYGRIQGPGVAGRAAA